MSAAGALEPLTAGTLAVHQARDAARRPRPTVEELRDGGRFEVEEFRVPWPPGGPEVLHVSARPVGVAGPLPLLSYLHGGAIVMGIARSVLPRWSGSGLSRWGSSSCRVEYRLAPGVRYPEPHEDCRAGLVRAARHAAGPGIDPDRIVIGGAGPG
ncbi:alpha/beta hydrolase, partial [Streptomyces sp. NPDC006553]|uniref:alpha/beta hydrolase n=1 Tax=Streptomyces sp. NPDC006553 TaxID=3157180 RepID=UPI0033A860E4